LAWRSEVVSIPSGAKLDISRKTKDVFLSRKAELII
jgi:hypothetical protein